ncbi:MAG TPA: mercuric transport protein MerTP [Bacteroidia bacterium]|jgi:copper chaperone CopZ
MKQGKLIGASLLSAVAASLCCITPLLVIFAGAGGAASNFSWIEPARPYLAGFTFLILGVAWYQKFRPAKANVDECGCEIKKTSFWQSKSFLLIVTVFTIGMLAFPLYSHVFYPTQEKQGSITGSKNLQTAEFKISGMTCESCEQHIIHALNKHSEIISVNVSYEKSNALIQFDEAKISIDKIKESINSTGYSVKETIIKK